MTRENDTSISVDEKTPQAELTKWAESTAYYCKGFSGKHYPPHTCQVMNMLDKRVHEDDFYCAWQSPYGFVPEAGYPKHD